MFVIGLTGSIATGKTTISNWFKEWDIPVFDADLCVHKLFESDQEVKDFIQETWPHCIKNSRIDRHCLRTQIMEEKTALKKLEDITHPKVKKTEEEFIKRQEQQGHSVVVLDVPLLYESGHNKLTDCVILAYCSPEVQRKRAQKRDISLEVLEHLISLQIPVSEKMFRADFTINTDGTLDETHNLLVEKIKDIESRFNVKIIRN